MHYGKIRHMFAIDINEKKRALSCGDENVDIGISIHSKNMHFCLCISESFCL